MRATPVLIGAFALAGTGFVVASSNAREPGPIPAQAQPAAPQQAPAVPVQAAAPAQAAPAQAAAPQPAAAPTFTPEQKAVADTIGAFAKAYGTADAKVLAEFFTDDVVVTDPEGVETRGKKAVAEMYAGAFQENPGLKLESEVAEVRFITPDVARVEGQSAAFLGQGRRVGVHALQLAPGPQGRQVASGRDPRIHCPGRGCRPL